MENRTPRFSVYKANKTNTGSALQFDLAPHRQAVFVEAAKQSGERSFDWSSKITMKLSTTDLGKLLSVLNGKKKEVKLFHDPSKGEYDSAKDTKNSVLEFGMGAYGYLFKLSQQAHAGGVNQIQVPLSDDEAEILKVLFGKAIERIYEW